MYSLYADSVPIATERVFVATVGERLIALRDRSGLTLNQIALAANYRGRSSVQKFFAADYNPPYLDSIVGGRIARALVGYGTPPISSEEVFALCAPQTTNKENFQNDSAEGIRKDIGVNLCLYVKTVPIIKGQDAVDIYMVEMDNPVSYIWHPPALLEHPDIYALRMQQRPLHPRFRPGEIVVIDPTTPSKLGDDVCVHIQEIEADYSGGVGVTGSALVVFGTLERYFDGEMHLRTIDGKATFSVPDQGGREIHRILSTTDCLS